MATLSRVTGKVFGGNAPLDEIGQFGSAKSGTPLNTQDVATIQALSAYTNGWGSAIMTSRNFPPIEEVTGVLKTISYQNCYLLQEGVPTYDVGTNYSATSIVKVINGTNLSFYVSLVDDNLGNSLSDGTKWAKASFADRAIGEIVTSAIPLSDSGLHLLDGSVLSGSGIYAQFVSYIADIYSSGLNYFCSEADWQQSITNYGVCGKFVYTPASGDNPATVRLPKVTGIVEGTLANNKLGNLVQAGLPNITAQFALGSSSSASGAVYINGEIPGERGGAGGTDEHGYFDASRSSSIYGNSTSVQPQTVKVLYYIVVATTQKTDLEVDIDNIATDINNINLAISNMAGKPDWDDTVVTVSEFTSNYTIPYDCFVVITHSTSTGFFAIYVNNQQVGSVTNELSLILSQGDTIRYSGSASGYLTMRYVRLK